MESTEAVLNGEAKADAAWFANARYLLSNPQGQSRVKLQEKIMLSPIAGSYDGEPLDAAPGRAQTLELIAAAQTSALAAV